MPRWDNPDWVNEGRTGPNGPRYAKRKDRAQVARDHAKAEHNGCLGAALGLAGVGGALLVAVAVFVRSAYDFVSGAI